MDRLHCLRSRVGIALDGRAYLLDVLPAASTSSASRLKSAASVRNAAMIESMSAEAIFSGKLVIDRSALCCCLNSLSVLWRLKRQTWSRLTEIPGKEEIDPYKRIGILAALALAPILVVFKEILQTASESRYTKSMG